MTDYRAHYVAPGTTYQDEPSEQVPPGWYVLGDCSPEGFDPRTVIKVEQAFDADRNDWCGEMAKDLAGLMNQHFGGSR